MGHACCASLVPVGNHHVRAACGSNLRHFAANSARAAYNQRDPAAELLLSRLTANLCLFQRPVFDAEGLNGGQRNIVCKDLEARRLHALRALRNRSRHFAFSQQAGALHHVNGVRIELAGNAGFGLVLAKAEHAQTLNQNDCGTRVAQRRRVRRGKCLVVCAVLLAVLRKCNGNLLSQNVQVRAGLPWHKQRTYLRADKVIGATGAEERKLFRVN